MKKWIRIDSVGRIDSADYWFGYRLLVNITILYYTILYYNYTILYYKISTT